MQARRQPTTKAKSGANATADRAIDILMLFTDERQIWTFAEIAERFTMPRSTAYRYLTSLRNVGLVVEDEGGGFRLGPKVISLARTAAKAASIVSIAAPHLAALSVKYGETIILNERVEHQIITLDRIESLHNIKATISGGLIIPWPATATSRVFLAFADESYCRDAFKLMKPHRFTSQTVTSLPELKRMIDRARADGHAVSEGERDEGLTGVAVPVLVRHVARYSLSIAVPSFRLPATTIAAIVSDLKAAAASVASEYQGFVLDSEAEISMSKARKKA